MILHEKFTTDTLQAYEMETLKSLDFDEVWYSYSYGSYEGSGQLIARKGDLYDFHDMGHCSCYGAIDHLIFGGKPLPELIDILKLNSFYWKQIEGLLKNYKLI